MKYRLLVQLLLSCLFLFTSQTSVLANQSMALSFNSAHQMMQPSDHSLNEAHHDMTQHDIADHDENCASHGEQCSHHGDACLMISCYMSSSLQLEFVELAHIDVVSELNPTPLLNYYSLLVTPLKRPPIV